MSGFQLDRNRIVYQHTADRSGRLLHVCHKKKSCGFWFLEETGNSPPPSLVPSRTTHGEDAPIYSAICDPTWPCLPPLVESRSSIQPTQMPLKKLLVWSSNLSYISANSGKMKIKYFKIVFFPCLTTTTLQIQTPDSVGGSRCQISRLVSLRGAYHAPKSPAGPGSALYLQPLNDWISVDMSDMIGAPRCCGFLFGRIHCGDHLEKDFFTRKIYTLPSAVRRLAQVGVWCCDNSRSYKSCFLLPMCLSFHLIAIRSEHWGVTLSLRSLGANCIASYHDLSSASATPRDTYAIVRKVGDRNSSVDRFAHLKFFLTTNFP